tara:strand:+ start:757 stop:1005 length:249 start_codon:yes stop_codon:yes gene_type:complete
MTDTQQAEAVAERYAHTPQAVAVHEVEARTARPMDNSAWLAIMAREDRADAARYAAAMDAEADRYADMYDTDLANANESRTR